VFDALTAVRSYKEAWRTTDAVAELARMVDNGRLDGRCVAALERSTEELEDRLRDVRPDRGV
jgi:HD-GYP domain-containing protein (c-di-GMP phosphodiesterase class II)